ncbi:hypothetical protein [Rufibacter latericius]|uniref:Uncharacterized protein n=1 Tax=Rufibacter latericius TaxID=2487040 RepID=A0A3M9MM52_9BACT|nr:hypothetical protein [Rufibacter latericius]RNI26606.1 hypothetical protein EFB08_11345 [Rufibacter latericius]
MQSHLDDKIEEVYRAAEHLGLNPKTPFEAELFKKALRGIAALAVDEMKAEVTEVMSKITHRHNV